MLKALAGRENGTMNPGVFMERETRQRYASMRLIREFRPIGCLPNCSCGGFSCLDLSHDNSRLLTGDTFGGFSIHSTFDVNYNWSPREQYTLKLVGNGTCSTRSTSTEGSIRAFIFCPIYKWHPTDTTMFSGSGNDGSIQIWATERLAKPIESSKQVGYARHSMNPIEPPLMAGAVAEVGAQILDLRIGLDHPTLSILPQCRGRLLDVAWNPSNSCRLFLQMEHDPVQIFHTQFFEFDTRSPRHPIFIYERPDYVSPCHRWQPCMRFSGDGGHLYTLSMGYLTEFDTGSGRLTREIRIPAVTQSKKRRDWPIRGYRSEFCISRGTGPEFAFIPRMNSVSGGVVIDLKTFLPVTKSEKLFPPATDIQVDSQRQVAYAAGATISVLGSIPELPKTEGHDDEPNEVLIDSV